MFDSNSLIDWSPGLPESGDTTAELEERLGLYRVFLKLYEHHRELLDEILDLENTDEQPCSKSVWRFVQGVIQDQMVYLTTNLAASIPAKIEQPQHIWVIGRDLKSGLSVNDKRLSRRHAMIRYINGGFYLTDLSSTNGSFVNGELVRCPTRLQHGDRVRLGSLSFVFFICEGSRLLPPVPAELLSQISRMDGEEASAADQEAVADPKQTYSFLKASDSFQPIASAMSLSKTQQADILNRFLNR
jgi:pSer/pThr/pTyr-binding forkhead associated (FHA) protein